MPHRCAVCREWGPGTQDQHNCSGTPVPSMKPLWQRGSLSSADLNAYTFPDLAAITGSMETYFAELNKTIGAAPRALRTDLEGSS